jgi:DNA-binding LytR/AlgR family response regulator
MAGEQRVILVEDEALARAGLAALLNNQQKVNINVIGQAETTQAGWNLIEQGGVDGVFLDINFQTESDRAGLDLAYRINGMSRPPWIIFVTGHSEFAVEAYDVHPAHFILKPITPAKLEKALEQVKPDKPVKPPNGSERMAIPHYMNSPAGRGTRVVEIVDPRQDIVYVSTIKRSETVKIHLQDCRNLQGVSGTLKTWEERLGEYGFVRISKVFLVNAHYFRRLEPHPLRKDVYQLFLRGCGCGGISCRKAGIKLLKEALSCIGEF